LDFKRRGRLGRVKRATKGEGISLKGKGGEREGEKKNFSSHSRPLPAPLPSSQPLVLQIQHGGYD